MITTSTAFNQVANATIRPIAQRTNISFTRARAEGLNWFTLDQSQLDGIDILGLDEFIGQPPRLLSLGQRMKADLAASLLHNPEILFLDEPTIGIDVLSKERIRNFILQVNKERKTTVILTTHDVSDIETLCEKMMVIDKGVLLYDGNLTELKALYKTTDLEEIIKKIYLNGIIRQGDVDNAQVS